MASAFKVQCPKCDSRLRLATAPPPEKRLKCPKCQHSFYIAARVSDADEWTDEVDGYEDDLWDSESENEPEAVENIQLPPRKSSSKQAGTRTPEALDAPEKNVGRRWILWSLIGGGVLLFGVAAILIAMVVSKSDYDRLHDDWHAMASDHIRNENPQLSSSEVRDKADKVIAGIQNNIDPASYFNFMLPEAQRKELVLEPILKEAAPTYQAFRENLMKENNTDNILKVIEGYGVEIYPWLLPVAERIKAGTATDRERFLFDALMLHKILTALA